MDKPTHQPQFRILVADGDAVMRKNYLHIFSPERTKNKLMAELWDLAAEIYQKAPSKDSTGAYELVCCQNGQETITAMTQACQSSKPFILAFIDSNLQEPSKNWDGIQIAEHIRGLDPFVEIVLVTDNPEIASNSLVRRIPPAHKLTVLHKPFQFRQILQFASILTSKWLLENEFIKIRLELEKRVQERTEALQWERNFFAQVMDTAGALVIVLDKRGRVIRFNRVCEEISGYSFEEVKGAYIWDLFQVPEDMLPIQSTFKEIRDGNFPSIHENDWITKSGERRLISWSATSMTISENQVDYGVWIGMDITERKRMEEELRASEERYRALIENVRDGVALIQDNKVLFVNDAFLHLFGYDSADQVIDRDTSESIVPYFDSKFAKFLHTAMDEKSWGLPYRGPCHNQKGNEIWVECTSTIIRYGGQPTNLLTIRDITETIMWEQTIKEEAEYFRSEADRLKSSIGERYRLVNIIGKSPAMQKVYEMILMAAESDANVIILGKSGTGKELAARAIHELSDRADNPFVPVNCGAIPENLIESEFFGYKRGAFTGANRDKDGYMDAANTGTLFLDEVGDIGLNMQVKLLRAIENGEYTPVGHSISKTADIRFIAATNKDPSDLVRQGLMREDFFYRISVIPIQLPALKERKEDIPLLVDHFLKQFSDGDSVQSIPLHVMNKLMSYDWPGNVRELQNVLQRYLTVKSLDFLQVSNSKDLGDLPPIPDQQLDGQHLNLKQMLDELEKQILVRVLETHRWNQTRSAQALGISRRSLFRRIKRLGI